MPRLDLDLLQDSFSRAKDVSAPDHDRHPPEHQSGHWLVQGENTSNTEAGSHPCRCLKSDFQNCHSLVVEAESGAMNHIVIRVQWPNFLLNHPILASPEARSSMVEGSGMQ